jgi:hypothetical protein
MTSKVAYLFGTYAYLRRLGVAADGLLLVGRNTCSLPVKL